MSHFIKLRNFWNKIWYDIRLMQAFFILNVGTSIGSQADEVIYWTRWNENIRLFVASFLLISGFAIAGWGFWKFIKALNLSFGRRRNTEGIP